MPFKDTKRKKRRWKRNKYCTAELYSWNESQWKSSCNKTNHFHFFLFVRMLFIQWMGYTGQHRRLLYYIAYIIITVIIEVLKLVIVIWNISWKKRIKMWKVQLISSEKFIFKQSVKINRLTVVYWFVPYEWIRCRNSLVSVWDER